MKTKFRLLLCALFLAVLPAHSQLTLENIFNAIQNSSNSFMCITEKSVILNSTGNALLGGSSVVSIQVTLPQNTQKWYYRITVLKKSDTYNYQANEKFCYLLQNNMKAATYSGAIGYNIDFFLIGHSGQLNSFLNGDTFTPLGKPFYNVNSFIHEASPTNSNLWIGIRNINNVQGLRVIVEAVAWGKFNN